MYSLPIRIVGGTFCKWYISMWYVSLAVRFDAVRKDAVCFEPVRIICVSMIALHAI